MVTSKMSEDKFVCQNYVSEDSRTQVIGNELADIVIDGLRKLDAEYDLLLKNTEEIREPHRSHFEVENDKDELKVSVHNFVKQKIKIIDDVKRIWEEEELSLKVVDIQEMVRICQKENETYLKKKSLLERRLKIKNIQIDSINKEIKGALELGENNFKIEEQLKIVTEDIEKLQVNENIYPEAILEMHMICNDLLAEIEDAEKGLLKYGDLPPDYSKAKEKLAEAMIKDEELDRVIRKFIVN